MHTRLPNIHLAISRPVVEDSVQRARSIGVFNSPNPLVHILELPPRLAGQSLLGYMRQHLARIEFAVAVGIKKKGLVLALQGSGFTDCRPRYLDRALYHVRRQPKVTLGATEISPEPSATSLPWRSFETKASTVKAAVPPPSRPAIAADRFRARPSFDYAGTANLDVTKLL